MINWSNGHSITNLTSKIATRLIISNAMLTPHHLTKNLHHSLRAPKIANQFGRRFVDLVRARHRAEQAYFHHRTQKLLLGDRPGKSLRALAEQLVDHPRLKIKSGLIIESRSWRILLEAQVAIGERLDLPLGDLVSLVQDTVIKTSASQSVDRGHWGDRLAALEAVAERRLSAATPEGMRIDRGELRFVRPLVLAVLGGKKIADDLPLPSGQTVPASRLFAYCQKGDVIGLMLKSLEAEARQTVKTDLSGASYLKDFPQFLNLSSTMLELDTDTKRQLVERAPLETPLQTVTPVAHDGAPQREHLQSGGRKANDSSEVKEAGTGRFVADDEPPSKQSVMPRSIGQRPRPSDISKFRNSNISTDRSSPSSHLSLKSLLGTAPSSVRERARTLRQRLAEPVAAPDISTYRNVEISSLPDVGEASQASAAHPDHTEDALLVDEDHGIYGLFDGNSAEPAGEVASSRTSRLVHRILKSLPESASSATVATALETALREAAGQLAKEVKRQPDQAGMATTASVLYRHGRGATLAHTGDSRIWILKPDQPLTQLTKDTASQISAASETARKKLKPQLLTIHVAKGDQFLLTSDGIHAVLDKPAIEQILRSVPSADQAAERLVEQAAKHRGATPADLAAIVVRI